MTRHSLVGTLCDNKATVKKLLLAMIVLLAACFLPASVWTDYYTQKQLGAATDCQQRLEQLRQRMDIMVTAIVWEVIHLVALIGTIKEMACLTASYGLFMTIITAYFVLKPGLFMVPQLISSHIISYLLYFLTFVCNVTIAFVAFLFTSYLKYPINQPVVKIQLV